MDIITGAVSGLFFDIAKDLLKDLVKSAIENKVKKITEEQVKATLIEHLNKMKPVSETNVNIEIHVGEMDKLLSEFYSVASAATGIVVDDGRIEIKRASLFRVPDAIREKRISQKVKRVKSSLDYEIKLEEQGFQREEELDTSSIDLPAPLQVLPQRELMFRALPAGSPPEMSHREVAEVVNSYREKIQSIIEAEEEPIMNMVEPYISERFQLAVACHLVMNLIELPNLHTPLLLGIHEPAGEGKTDECRWVFEKMGVQPDWIFSDEFEDFQAGIPAKNIKNRYKASSDFNIEIRRGYTANQTYATAHKLRVIFINDIDQRVGRSDNLIQLTINTQLINTSLMEIADNPKLIDGNPVAKVPIIVTGNNLGCLYEPLRRDGRMEKFEWVPTLEEKAKMVRRIFPESTLSDDDIATLLEKYGNSDARERKVNKQPSLSVSSLVTLRYRLYKTEVAKMVSDVGLSNVLDYVYSNKHLEHLQMPVVDVAAVASEIEKLHQDSHLENHVGG